MRKKEKLRNHYLDKALKISLFVLILFSSNWLIAQNQKVSLNRDAKTIKEAFNQIEKQAGVSIAYDETIIDVKKGINVNVSNTTLSEALSLVLKGSNCGYTINGKYVVIVVNKAPQTKEIKITGNITDESGTPIIGGNVILQGSKVGTITDVNGNFSIMAPLKSVIQVSYIGYIPQELTVNNQTNLKITLREDTRNLDEVVVIGYGSRAKKDVTTAISSISSDKIGKTIAASSEFAMQGQMSGVQVVGNSGNPNSRPTIRIRGVNTWGVSSPLYVIDGIPIKEYGAGIENDSYVRGNINIMTMIDPNDIESMSVLKDAASAAIYGVKAANGVILITTKKGKKEKTQVEYSYKAGIQNQNQRVDLMNAKEYADYFNTFFRTDPNWETNIDPINKAVFDPASSGYLGNLPSVDWQSVGLRKNALTEDHSLRLSGGTKLADYSASFGYNKQEGMRVGNDLERYSGAFKLNVDVNKYVRMGLNLRLTNAKGNTGVGGSIYDTGMTPPWQQVYDPNGRNGYASAVVGYNPDGTWNTALKYGTMTRNNILGLHSMTDEISSSLRTMGNVFLEIEPIKGLKLKGNISMDNFSNNIDGFYEFDKSLFQYGGSNPTKYPVGSIGNYDERRTYNNNMIYEFTANYVKSFGKNNIDALLNLMGQRNSMKFTHVFTNYITTALPGQRNLGGANEYTNAGGFQKRNALTGSFLRLGYNYDSKYYVDATVRRDGSSRFAPNYRWGVFPGVSVAWRMSSESFMSDISWIDDIKLRASWGKLGNDEVMDMAYLSTISTESNYVWGNNPSAVGNGYISSSAYTTSMPNELLTWENTTTRNIGFDFTLFKGLNGSVEYYDKLTSDLIQPVTLPLSAGLLSQPSDNIGEVSNKGIELNLTYNGKVGDLNYSVGGNFTTVKNRVEKMYGGIPINQIEQGYSMNFVRGFVLGGMFQSRDEALDYMDKVTDKTYKEALVDGGDFWFKDVRGAPTADDIAAGRNYSIGADGIVDNYDQTYVGKSISGYYYGFNFSLEYKGFDLNAQFTGVGDIQKYNKIKQTYLNTSQVAVNQSREILNYWRTDNTNTTIPRIRYGDPAGNNRGSTYFVENADYLRCANIQLGYTLPKSVYKASKDILNFARIYVGCSNLFTITKYTGLDPEDDNNPAPLTLITGLTVKF